MNIESRFKTYSVDFVTDLTLANLINDETVYFVIDKNVYTLYESKWPVFRKERLYLLDALEQNKTMDIVLSICEKMTDIASKRNTCLVSIGGGIVQDITGFVANILYRGIKWLFFPSTLLAACDSCIGGKTSLNYKGFKNLLGTFYPPDEIKIYPEFFKTLSQKDFASGLGEVVKFNVMAGKNGIDNIEKNICKLIERDNPTITSFVRNSLEFKKSFIEEDEFDKGKRILLNYAHTFGHAFEVSSNYGIPHGSAVALGMIVANTVSVNRGLLDSTFAKRIEDVCKKILPVRFDAQWFDKDIIITAIKKDKKQVNDTIRAILLHDDLSLDMYTDIEEREIVSALEKLQTVLP